MNLRSKLESKDEFKDIKENKDIGRLLKLIKAVVHQFETHTHPSMKPWTRLRRTTTITTKGPEPVTPNMLRTYRTWWTSLNTMEDQSQMTKL